jgi:hypothetical protein
MTETLDIARDQMCRRTSRGACMLHRVLKVTERRIGCLMDDLGIDCRDVEYVAETAHG